MLCQLVCNQTCSWRFYHSANQIMYFIFHSIFFSFGTNDLTQLTYGFSRDDAGKFINVYTESNISKAKEVTMLCQLVCNQTCSWRFYHSANQIMYFIFHIETPRACLIADQLAQHCDFFSFGTNDLTQLTYGFSRDANQIMYFIFHSIL
jgi:phosphoenolpyruvate synthase/pyruvate phosphate dikinase